MDRRAVEKLLTRRDGASGRVAVRFTRVIAVAAQIEPRGK
jgi:hypothetical protein